MRAVSDPMIHTVTIMGPTQLLKTEFCNNVVAYHIDQDPCPMLMVQPTDILAETWSKDRFDKMARDTPCLAEKVSEKKSRDSGNKITHKQFQGGQLSIVGANSPGNLAMRPIRVALCDEIDKYPASAGKEGDPLNLVKERTATFWNRKMIQVCSPTTEGKSRIAQEYELSDQRIYMVPCPHCGHEQEMLFRFVKWPENEPEKAQYHCADCDKPWLEHERLDAIGKGDWFATKPFKGHAGFRCSKLVSPWEPIAKLAVKFIEAKKNGPETLKVFVNTQLAETFKEKGDAPEWERLYRRREPYPFNTIPDGVVFLTAGVDVQKDRLECEIKGWGKGHESWSIDMRILTGDTLLDDVWDKLQDVLFEQWKSPKGPMIGIRMMAVDSGYNTQKVYSWVRKQPRNMCIAVKGKDSLQVALGTPTIVDVNIAGRKVKRGMRVWPVGVSILKSELYARLKLDDPIDSDEYPSGYQHYPEYDQEFFKQLTAETLVCKVVKGYRKYEWEKTRERNEALDTAVYNRAAAAAFGIDRFKDSDWDKLNSGIGVAVPKPSPKPSDSEAENKTDQRPRRAKKKSSFW